MNRGVHFVGSYPAPDARSAMRAMIEGVDRRIERVPDGETGGRRRGLIGQLSALRDEHPAVVIAPVGDCRALERFPRLALAATQESRFTARSLASLPAFDYVGRARGARVALDELSAEFELPLTLQVGVSHWLDLALLAFAPWPPRAHPAAPQLRAFAEHLHRQIQATVAAVGADRVLFQIESRCALLHPLGYLPQTAIDRDSPPIGQTIAEVINRCTPQARFGIHLCVGETEHRQVAAPGAGAAAIIGAVTDIADALRRPESLEYVHFPLAAGQLLPATEPSAYRPLALLRGVLPADTRIVAGLADARQSLAEQLRVRALVEDAVGARIDIAAACGLGQYSPELARRLVRRTVALSYADS
jgi:hypothetical protein